VLASQFSATVCELNCPPLPAKVIVNAPAELPIVMAPTALPVAEGANVTFSAAVCPGVNRVFATTPLAVNPAPLTTTLDIVTFALPAFVSVTPCELALPNNTLPKSRLLVLALSSAVVAVALPFVAIINGELGALLVNETEPVTFPAELGANTTLNVVFCPGAILIGSVRPEVPNPAPTTLALEIVTLAVPPFCSVIVCETLAPAVTPGKLALVGVAESCGWGVFVGGGVVDGGVLLLPEAFDPITTPAHPLTIIEAASTSTTRHFDVLLASDH
jgi:hypothetical protein